jgi:hypothetical protein
MDWGAFDWRDGILLLLVLAVLYVIVTLLKLTQVGRRRATSQVTARQAAPAPVEMLFESELPAPVEMVAAPPAKNFDWDDVNDLFGDAGEQPVTAAAPAGIAPAEVEIVSPDQAMPLPVQSVPQAPRAAGFGEYLAEHLVRSEMEMEVQRMRTEMERMRTEVEALRASRNVSPQYAEAMELAQRGMTAQNMADQLGISLAEAELVRALSRSDGNFDEGEQYGAEGNAEHEGFNAYGQPIRHSGG